MPELLIDGILSSSESVSGYGAENILSDKYKPWKGNPGSDNSIVLKISREEKISNISIGNQFSAFVDILVGNSCDDPPQFAALLPSHSFMDANESKKEVNGERVKIFAEDEMNTSISSNKWDLIKIVCKQPFNTNIPFGLRFIKIFGSGGSEDREKHLGEDKNVAANKADSCFEVLQRRLVADDVSNKQKHEVQLIAKQQYLDRMKSGCDKMREVRQLKRRNTDIETDDSLVDYPSKEILVASSLIPTTSMIVSSKGEYTSSSQLTSKRKQEPTSSINVHNNMGCVPSSSNQSESVSASTSSLIRTTAAINVKSNKSNETKRKRDTQGSSLIEEPLSGVRFALSGYENPRRSIIRDRAVSLGAKYLKEVDTTITHLVTAFKNTPKGKLCGNDVYILPAEWIERCFLERRRVNEALMQH